MREKFNFLNFEKKRNIEVSKNFNFGNLKIKKKLDLYFTSIQQWARSWVRELIHSYLIKSVQAIQEKTTNITFGTVEFFYIKDMSLFLEQMRQIFRYNINFIKGSRKTKVLLLIKESKGPGRVIKKKF